MDEQSFNNDGKEVLEEKESRTLRIPPKMSLKMTAQRKLLLKLLTKKTLGKSVKKQIITAGTGRKVNSKRLLRRIILSILMNQIKSSLFNQLCMTKQTLVLKLLKSANSKQKITKLT